MRREKKSNIHRCHENEIEASDKNQLNDTCESTKNKMMKKQKNLN